MASYENCHSCNPVDKTPLPFALAKSQAPWKTSREYRFFPLVSIVWSSLHFRLYCATALVLSLPCPSLSLSTSSSTLRFTTGSQTFLLSSSQQLLTLFLYPCPVSQIIPYFHMQLALQSWCTSPPSESSFSLSLHMLPWLSIPGCLLSQPTSPPNLNLCIFLPLFMFL